MLMRIQNIKTSGLANCCEVTYFITKVWRKNIWVQLHSQACY